MLIDTIRVDNKLESQDIVDLLSISGVRFEKTGQFAYRGIWDQCQEYIYISINQDKLIELKKHSEYIKKMCYEIYDDMSNIILEICSSIYTLDSDFSRKDIL